MTEQEKLHGALGVICGGGMHDKGIRLQIILPSTVNSVKSFKQQQL